MRQAEVNVYTFDELSDDAKEHAHERYLNEMHRYSWYGEAEDTIKALEEEFGISIERWSYSSRDYDYRLGLGSISDDVLALKGNRARAWFWNNHGDVLLSPEVHYWTHDSEGKLFEGIAKDSRKFKSKVFYERVYDGTCPFTGVCFDCDALDPMAEFCFGVRWDDKLKKRVPSSRKKFLDDQMTVEDIIRACVESLFQALKRDCEYQESVEYFEDLCEANEWEFDEDGDLWVGKEVNKVRAAS